MTTNKYSETILHFIEVVHLQRLIMVGRQRHHHFMPINNNANYTKKTYQNIVMMLYVKFDKKFSPCTPRKNHLNRFEYIYNSNFMKSGQFVIQEIKKIC